MANHDKEKQQFGKPLLNDGIHIEDQLGYKNYAEALSYQLNHVASPLTIGLFSKWGSGKSFLLRLTKEKLLSEYTKSGEIKFVLWYGIIFFFISITAILCFVVGMVIQTNWPLTVAATYAGILLLTVIIMLLLCLTSENRKSYWKLPICATFTKLRVQEIPDENINISARKFIYVDFNAWEHGGSDDIWAAIATSIVDGMEKEFGTFTVRIFRSIDIQKSQNAIFSCSKNSCHFRTNILIPLAVFPIVLLSVILVMFLPKNGFQLPHWVPPAVVVALGGTWATWKTVYAFCNSQRTRINRALNRTRKNMSKKLGFMKLVKNEVKAVSDLIHFVKQVYNEDYKIVLAIDDLDRVTHNKVRSILDAVNILLSDQLSPFFCLIAVDPVVAVNSIDERCDTSINVKKHGHEYLKKIINVPFCLPEVTPKLTPYLASMLKDENGQVPSSNDQEKTTQATVAGVKGNEIDERKEEAPNAEIFFLQNQAYSATWQYLQKDLIREHLLPNARNIKRIKNVVSMAVQFVKFHNLKDVVADSLSIPRRKHKIDKDIDETNDRFIKFFKDKSDNSKVNSIIKVGSHTSDILEKIEDNIKKNKITEVSEVKAALTKDFCENLTLLILMIEQWPFMTSILLQKFDDTFLNAVRDGRMVHGHTSLHEVYKKENLKDLKPNIAVDGDPLVFERLLKKMEKSNHGLKTTAARNLRKYAINFDLRQMQTYLAVKEDVVQTTQPILNVKPKPKTKRSRSTGSVPDLSVVYKWSEKCSV